MASARGCAPRGGVLSLPGAAGKGGSASRSSTAGQARTLPRSCRLTSRRQFLTVYERGRRVASSSFTLFGLPNVAGECRLGLTVTRKLGGAVRRNRVKRMLREVFRRNRERLEPALDLVINARSGVLEREAGQLEREFLGAFRRLARRIDR